MPCINNGDVPAGVYVHMTDGLRGGEEEGFQFFFLPPATVNPEEFTIEWAHQAAKNEKFIFSKNSKPMVAKFYKHVYN